MRRRLLQQNKHVWELQQTLDDSYTSEDLTADFALYMQEKEVRRPRGHSGCGDCCGRVTEQAMR